MSGRTGPHIALAFAVGLAAGVLTGCAHGDEGPQPVRTTPTGRTIPFTLSTHCGIGEIQIGSTYFEADDPLSDGSGNPPAGWNQPVQKGTMTLKSETEAVFTDDAGHEVTFHARPGATGFKNLCL
ncbi:hypothetical protein [Streptomyces sp. NBC_01304]|uniref:hypothetical protein n=1 Tax=Streptomyces sp. NBC_01304 TaxID=2903818 RepID=UPI002E158950|nr:hypothetical protein OG430_04725 [Streptomyces sp. NBC_01304]